MDPHSLRQRPQAALLQHLTQGVTLPPSLRAGLERYRAALKQLDAPGGHSYRAGALEAAADELDQLALPGSLGAALCALQELFEGCQDVIYRPILIGGSRPAMLLYVDGMIQTERLEQSVIPPLTSHRAPGNLPVTGDGFRIWLESVAMGACGPCPVETIGQVVDGVLTGQAVLLVDGPAFGLALSLQGGKERPLEEPLSESMLRGPREGFTEVLPTNLTLLRRRIKTPHLKAERLCLGRRTKTQVMVLYLKDIADPDLVREVHRRLGAIDIDGVLDTGMIEEFIEDQPASLFPQIGNTERPDRVAAALLEGRVAILAEGSPFALVAPETFWSLMQASEDYYERFWLGSFLRWLRYTFLLIALLGPAAWVAITTFHQEMLPTALLLSIASAREGLPFPAIVEITLMELFFEALREAGVRLPRHMGQAVSIVGALVIGQAAVTAGLVSPPIVIIVAATGIATFTIPRYNLSIPVRLLRFPLIALGGALGLLGVTLGLIALLVHLCALRSFGVPYLEPVAPFSGAGLKDVLMRVPVWLMNRRPPQWNPLNPRRLARWSRRGKTR